MRVRKWTARLLAWVSLLLFTATALEQPRYAWDYYTLWNTVLNYLASVVAITAPDWAQTLAGASIVSSWATASTYTIIVFLTSLQNSSDPLFWIATAILHYVPPFLALASYNPPRSPATLAACLAIGFVYALTHDVASLYGVSHISHWLLVVIPLAFTLFFFTLLPGEYLCAPSRGTTPNTP